MPIFPGVLMCKLIHLRTQVRTVSVRICVYSYATSSSETDSCVQTGTSLDCVYMTEICRGTESCSIDSEEKKKKYSKKIQLWLFLPFSHQNYSLKVFHGHQWVLTIACGDHQYQQACIPNTKILFEQVCECRFFQESQDWSLIESGWDLGPFAAVLIPDKHLVKQQNTKKL